jgi:hypothetical protein
VTRRNEPDQMTEVGLLYWWRWLSAEERAHARQCVSDGRGDRALALTFRACDIGFLDSQPEGPGSYVVFIPQRLRDFVSAQPKGPGEPVQGRFPQSPGPHPAHRRLRVTK